MYDCVDENNIIANLYNACYYGTIYNCTTVHNILKNNYMDNMTNNMIHDIYIKMIYEACKNNGSDVIEYLINLCEYKCNIIVNKNILFLHACAGNNFKIVKWLFKKYNIDVNYHTKYEIYDSIDISAIAIVCIRENIELFNWLVNNNVNVHDPKNDNIFVMTVRNKLLSYNMNYEFQKKMYDFGFNIFGKIQFSSKNAINFMFDSFDFALYSGNYNFAKYLMSVGFLTNYENSDNHKKNIILFSCAKLNNYNMCKWIYTKIFKYIDIDKNEYKSFIKSYNIVSAYLRKTTINYITDLCFHKGYSCVRKNKKFKVYFLTDNQIIQRNINLSKKHLDIYKEELIIKTWHPKRLLQWCI